MDEKKAEEYREMYVPEFLEAINKIIYPCTYVEIFTKDALTVLQNDQMDANNGGYTMFNQHERELLKRSLDNVLEMQTLMKKTLLTCAEMSGAEGGQEI